VGAGLLAPRQAGHDQFLLRGEGESRQGEVRSRAYTFHTIWINHRSWREGVGGGSTLLLSIITKKNMLRVQQQQGIANLRQKLERIFSVLKNMKATFADTVSPWSTIIELLLWSKIVARVRNEIQKFRQSDKSFLF
jgi:hypothetical protein